MLSVIVIRDLHRESHVSLLIAGIALLFAAVALVGKYLDGYTIAGNEQRVSQGDEPFQWPLTEPQGVVRCDKAGAITFTAKGVRYGMNARALGERGVVDIRSIVKTDPKDKTKDMDWGGLRKTALALCR